MRRCIGLNSNLRRCNRVGPWRFFCADHSRQWLAWLSFLIFTVIAGAASIYSLFPLHQLLNQTKFPTYNDFSLIDIPDQAVFCKKASGISDPVYKDICAYYTRPNSKLVSLSRSKDNEANTVSHIKRVAENQKIALMKFINTNYASSDLRIEPLNVDFLSDECRANKEYLQFLRGAILSLGYYSSFRRLLMNSKTANDILPRSNSLPSPEYIYDYADPDSDKSNYRISIKPKDLINSDLFEVNDLVDAIASLTKEDQEAIKIFLVNALKYKGIYLSAKKRLILDKEFDSFIEDAEFGNIFITGKSFIDLSQYGIDSYSKCFSGFGYLNFKQNKNTSYWSFSPHDYLISFWFRRDLDGSISLTNNAIKLMLNYLG